MATILPNPPPPPPVPSYSGTVNSKERPSTDLKTQSCIFRFVTVLADQLDRFEGEPSRPDLKSDLGKTRVILDLDQDTKTELIHSIETFLTGTSVTRNQKRGITRIQVRVSNKDGMTHLLERIGSLVFGYKQVSDNLQEKKLLLEEREKGKRQLETQIERLREGSKTGRTSMRLDLSDKEPITFQVFSKTQIEAMRTAFSQLSPSDQQLMEKHSVHPDRVKSIEDTIEQRECKRTEILGEIQDLKDQISRLSAQKRDLDRQTIPSKDRFGNVKQLSFKDACDLFKKKQQIALRWSTILSDLKRSQEELMQIEEVEEVEVDEHEQKLAELLNNNPALAPLREFYDVSKQFETLNEQVIYGRNLFEFAQ